MICDCHVNVYEDSQMLPLFVEQSRIARPGGFAPKSDPATVIGAMQGVDKAIVFSLRYKDSIGIDGDDEVTARTVAMAPDKIIGFAAVDPRRPDAMELLRHAIEDLKLKGVKFGPIYNGVSLLDPRITPVYEYWWQQPAAHDAHGHHLRPERPGGARPARRRGHDRLPLSRPEDGDGAYGPPLIRGVHRRRPQERRTSIARSRRSTTGPGSSTTS